MKKLLSLFLSVLIILTTFSIPVNATSVPVDTLPIIADTSMVTRDPFIFNPPLPKYDWGGLQPAKLTGVQYQLADNVVRVNSDLTESISRTGFLNEDKIKTATGATRVKPGTVFVDFENKASYQVASLPEKTNDQYNGYVPVVKPSFRSVFKDFKIPVQNVKLNTANISHFENDTDKFRKKPGQTYVMSYDSTLDPIKPTHLKDPMAEFYFPKDTTVSGTTPSGGHVSVTVNGYLGIGDMYLNGDYSASGYEFYFSVTEEMQLQVVAAATLNEEIRIPILGVDIGFDNDVGSIAGGLFLVVGVNGQFTIKMEARQWTTINKAGLKGKNFLGIPYTIRPLFEMGDSGFNLDSRFNGAVDGYIKGGALLELSLFGLDLIGAGAFAGMGASSVVSGDYIETDLYGLLQAYVKFLGKTKHIVNWQPNIMHKRQMNTAGYQVTFKEACAYRDEVWGMLEYDYGSLGGYKREPDKEFYLVVQDLEGKEKEYQGNTDANGDFHVSNVDLRKDYKVYLRLEPKLGGEPVKSEAITPTFPFNKVVLLESDFFNDYVKGYVPSVYVKDWVTQTDKEIKFDLNYDNESDSSLDVKLSTLSTKKLVSLDKDSCFMLTSANILPQTISNAILTYDGFVITSNPISATAKFELLSDRITVSNTYSNENGKPVNIIKVSDKLSLINTRGTKQYVGDVKHTVNGYTQESVFCYIQNPDTGLPVLQKFGLPEQTATIKFAAASNAAEEEYGTSTVTNMFIKKWFWEPKPAVTRPAITPTRPVLNNLITPTTNATSATTGTVLGDFPVIPLNDDLLKKLALPQHTYTLSFDDPMDKYSDYYDSCSEWVDGTNYIKWDEKISFNYEGATITAEAKDNYETRSNTGSKFETMPADWSEKDIGSILDRYLDVMEGRLVMPAVDQLNITSGISNLSMLPAWSKTAAQNMVNAGIMDLEAGGTFKSGKVTRSECAAYLSKAFGIQPIMKSSAFSDIVTANPYIPEINAAVSFGIISGYSPTTFGPGDYVTREQMAVMAMKGLKLKLGSSLQIPNSSRAFTDRDKFSSWSETAVNEISSLGIMNGYTDGSFGAKGNITFNEMAVMLNNLTKLVH